jgi:hypothetical protein
LIHLFAPTGAARTALRRAHPTSAVQGSQCFEIAQLFRVKTARPRAF